MGSKHKLGETTHDNAMPAPEAGAATPLEAERSLLRAAAATIPAGSLPPRRRAGPRDPDIRSRLLRK